MKTYTLEELTDVFKKHSDEYESMAEKSETAKDYFNLPEALHSICVNLLSIRLDLEVLNSKLSELKPNMEVPGLPK